MGVLQPFAALYVLILASASPLLAKEPERIYALLAKLLGRLGKRKTAGRRGRRGARMNLEATNNCS